MSNSDFISEVDRVTREVIGPAAPKVDAEAAFPRASIDALAKIGALGALSAKDVGGNGAGLRGAAEAVERIARECGSTAMIYTMHLSAAAVLEKHAPVELRKEVASSRLVTLALSEAGSRSHFWAPVGTAKRVANGISLDAKKSFSTSAHNADYVWSSKPVEGSEASSLWFVPRATKGINVGPQFDGLGLRGNDSTSITATDAVIPESARLGADGEGFKTMMEVVLPVFQILAAACSIGVMEGAIGRTADHVSGAKFEHMGSALRDLPTIRAYVARMRVLTDMAKSLLGDTLDAVEKGRPDTMLRVLEVKAGAGETSTTVLDLAMRVCGGVAFRKEVGVERMFRDARAATVMSPTTDLLYDFIGKAVTGLPLF